MNFLLYIVLFVSGLAAGSFVNVVALRYQPQEKILGKRTIGGRSRCPFCHKELKWFELIPLISFLRQKGKCNYCGRFLFWQYPIIEFLSGLIFVFVPQKLLNFQFFPTFQSGSRLFVGTIFNFQSILNYQLLIAVIWVLIFELFLLVAIIDFRQYIIPDQINILLAAAGIILIILNQTKKFLNSPPFINPSFLGYYNTLFAPFPNVWVNHIFAAVLGMGFFGAIIILTKGKGMGWGDFKLAGALGLILGWGDILVAVAIAFVTGSLVSVVLMLKNKKTMKDAVPFGPFLAAGAATVFFFGYQLINLYFGFFMK